MTPPSPHERVRRVLRPKLRSKNKCFVSSDPSQNKNQKACKKVSHSRAPVNGEEADDDGDHLGRVHEEEVGVDVSSVLPHGAPDEAEVNHEGGEPGCP